MYLRPTSLALILICAALPSCGVFQSAGNGPGDVENLIDRIQKVRVDAELVQREVRGAMDRLRFLVAGQSERSAKRAFDAFQAAAADTRTQVARLRASIPPMQAAAEPVFARWEAKLDDFHNPTIRRRSQARLDDSRANYMAIIRTLEPAQAACETFNQILHTHESLLAAGMSQEVITGIRNDVQQLAGLEAEIQRRLDRSLLAARVYVENSGMPGVATQVAEPLPMPPADPPAAGR